MNRTAILVAVLACGIVTGCRNVPREPAAAIDLLTTYLDAMLPQPDAESRMLAEAAVHGWAELAGTYNVEGPAIWHNIMVNAGQRDRGLCCHWTRDMMDKLSQLELTRFELHWAVAHFGGMFEHNCVVVTPVGGRLEDGVIIDGWRETDRLYFDTVRHDDYPWRPHPMDSSDVLIICDTPGDKDVPQPASEQ